MSEACNAEHYPGWKSTDTHMDTTASHLIPVLVAHNGFAYDFPLLLAEIERRPKYLSTQELVTHNVRFADTLPHLRQVLRVLFHVQYM